MKIFVSGGAKNGKSSFAQDAVRRLAGSGPLYYIATMDPHDDEDDERIRRHVADRAGMGFQTVECPRNILDCLSSVDPDAAFLLDSVTALLSNEMFPPPLYETDALAGERVAGQLVELSRRVRDIVFVSDFIYSDAGVFSETTEQYRRAIAYVDRALAAECDGVAELCAANVIWHKGGAPL
jgi:adenosylcobinamide kinase/adenosylcobinamide-phosphate guanylyltransferase